MYCQKEQASNSGLCRTFPKGSHYLITCIFILHLLFTVYLLNFDPLGLEGLWQYSVFAQRGNTTRVVILMGRWRIPWLLEFSADAFLTTSQQDTAVGVGEKLSPAQKSIFG